MADVTIEITGEARQLQQTFDEIQAGQRRLDTGFSDVGQSGADASRQIDSAAAATGRTMADTAAVITDAYDDAGTAGVDAATDVANANRTTADASVDAIADVGLAHTDAGRAGVDAAASVQGAQTAATDAMREGQQAAIDGAAAVGEAGVQSARQIEAANESAATRGAATYDRLKSELRKLGPEGREVAKAFEAHMQEAGIAGRRSIGEILDEIRDFDPTSAAAMDKVTQAIEEAAQRGESAFGQLADTAATKIAAIGAGYLSLQTVMSTVTAYLKEQEEAAQKSLDTHLSLVDAQVKASQQMAALSAAEQNQLLAAAVPQIVRDAGFADAGQVTLGLGSAVMAGATADQAQDITRESARATVLTPDALPDLAKAVTEIMQSTGMADPREVIALIQSAQSSATQAGQDPAQLLETLPSAIAEAMRSDDARRRPAADTARIAAAGVIDPEAEGRDLVAIASRLQATTEAFERSVERNRTLTPQMAMASAQATNQASIEAGQIETTEAARLAQLRAMHSQTMQATNRGGIGGFVQNRLDYSSWGSLGGGDFANEAMSALDRQGFELRRTRIDGDDDTRRNQLRGSMASVESMVTAEARSGRLSEQSLESAAARARRLAADDTRIAETSTGLTAQLSAESAASLNRMIAVLEQQLEIQRQTARNTRQQPPDTSAAIRAQAASQDQQLRHGR